MPDRRAFLSTFAAAAAATALPIAKIYDGRLQSQTTLPDASLYAKDEEAYWTAVRKQFLIPEDEVYLNNGTVGSSPLPVLKAIVDCYHDAERMAQSDPEDYPIWGYAA
jgi:isopenicillin-N epimerase